MGVHRRPRILYITPCWPHAPSFGSQLRILHLARALKQLGDLKLAVLDIVHSDKEAVRKTADEFEVECSGVMTIASERSLIRRLRRAVDPRALNPNGFTVDTSTRSAVLSKLQEFDVVWCSYLKTIECLEQWKWPNAIMDIDDVPSTYERTIWQTGQRMGTRLRALRRMIVMKRREQLLQTRFPVLCLSSEPDRQYLRSSGPVYLIPNGFERPKNEPTRTLTEPPRIGFIGQFEYPPNSHGVDWFVKNCWPQIKHLQPDLELRLIGKATDGPLKPAGPDIHGLGFVADPTDEIATWRAMIVPIHIGAGTRVKVIEAFSRKCPIVGTTIGVFGREVENNVHLLIADTPEQFIRACLKLVQNPAEAAAMAERAWQTFLAKWTWESVQPQIADATEHCLRLSKHGHSEPALQPSFN